MKVLVVGGGGREHALCWKLRQSPLLTELYCAPGNPGIGEIATLVPIPADEIHRLVDFAEAMRIDLTVVGPELPLSLGLADELAARGLAVFGPRKAAAEIEGSKVFAKQFMERYGIPTAPFAVVHDAAEARAAAQRLGFPGQPVVLKADGLAAGKGVLVIASEAELADGLAALFDERRFGASADRVVVEGFLSGEEISFMALCDGERLLPLAPAKDYKRIGEGDTGPNTGGMGSHSPTGVMSAQTAAEIVETVLQPCVAGLAAEDRRFVGVIYAGIMLTAEGPRVLEFNARFGDPEAQVLLLRLEDDLLPILAAGAAGRFEVARLHFRPEAAVCVVLAAPGYPGRPQQGEVIGSLASLAAIAGSAERSGVEIFHAGTALVSTVGAGDALVFDTLVSAGGRVLNVCASAPELVDALRKAYTAAASIDWPTKVYRRDIGKRVLQAAAVPGS